ncbi:MAG: glutamate--tRNA ligase, partial [Ginsengibacter sp.]
LGWETYMCQWAHLPLILKPDGNGKLSKRDGERLGFPVFALQWKDPTTGDILKGFKELGFLPEAFINMLALLGWNDGTEQEIFSMDELIEKFSIERIHSSGAKFDFDKAKWFNHEWIKTFPVTNYQAQVKKILNDSGIDDIDDNKLEKVLALVKDRCTLLTDFVQQSSFFFKSPEKIDVAAVKSKWDEKKNLFFIELIRNYQLLNIWQHDNLEKDFKEIAAANQLRPGDILSSFRIMLVGGKYGPGVFDIASVLGKEETIQRITYTLKLLGS